MTAGSSGNGAYRVIMPCRFTEVAEDASDKSAGSAAPAPAMAA